MANREPRTHWAIVARAPLCPRATYLLYVLSATCERLETTRHFSPMGSCVGTRLQVPIWDSLTFICLMFTAILTPFEVQLSPRTTPRAPHPAPTPPASSLSLTVNVACLLPYR